jgi:hypothetical protein
MAKMTAFKTVDGLNKALKALPKDASEELRGASMDIAQDVATRSAGEARGQGGVAALVAPTIRVARDRIPAVRMGNSTRIDPDRTGDRQTIGDIMWGAEFGGRRRSTTQQFLPWRGSGSGAGYFLWPTVRAMEDQIQDRYSEALDDALQAMK